MAKKTPDPITVSDDAVRALLERYKCPVPWHQVRTRFLGNIASPVMAVSPIKVVQSLWGGELPEFESLDDANELIGALVMGLWNRLSRHQDRNAPFHLTRIQTSATRQGLAELAQIRMDELDGFIDGLFGAEEALDVPERARRGLDALSQMRALFAAVVEVATDESKPGTEKDMEATVRHIREMTKIGEHEMHATVMACARARRQMLEALPAKKPVLH